MKALALLLVLWGASAAAQPVSFGLVTGLDFATDHSATQAGAGVRLMGGVDVGVEVVEHLELAIGYRWLPPASSADELVSTDGHRVTFGPRFHAPVSEHWSFVFAITGEATYLDLSVTLPENSGDAGAWAFGATPSVGFDGSFPMGDDSAWGIRFDVGWGIRTTHDYHAVRLHAEGDNVMPLDLGDLNLSGVEGGISVRFGFR